MAGNQEKPRTHAFLNLAPVGIADDGSYWKATNVTPGTGIAQGIIAAYDALKALFVLKNPTTSGKVYYMDYLRLIPTVVPASATRSEIFVVLENLANFRYASAGTTLVQKNASMQSDNASAAVAVFGALVLNAAGANERKLARAQLRNAIPVAFEEYVVSFGGTREHYPTTMGGTTGVRNIVNVGPAVAGPGHEVILHSWHPSNATTGATWEVEAAWFERLV